jgi:nucleoside-diphosphate-sugar epimerase
MKILVAGGTGAVGRRLVPLLVSRGHSVAATTHTPARSDLVRTLGAEPILADGLDRHAVERAVEAARPEVIVHEMTSLANLRNPKHFDRVFARTNRLRIDGTRYLIEAARALGVRRLVAQSYTGWPYAREGGPIKVEDDPLDATPPRTMRKTLEAIRTLEHYVRSFSGLEGVVLRYGSFYGPGTPFAPGGEVYESIRRRRFPVVGCGTGIWSFVHIDDVAIATAIAAEGGPTGVFNIVDDEPAEVAVWLPELAFLFAARPPRRVPVWLARLLIGDAGVSLMTEVRGASNAKAKRVLGWQPLYPSWRDGFRWERLAHRREDWPTPAATRLGA